MNAGLEGTSAIAGAHAGAVVPLQPGLRGCGKIDYPDPILNKRLSLRRNAWMPSTNAARHGGRSPRRTAPAQEIGGIVAGIVARKKYVILCTNALLLEKKLTCSPPSPYLTFSIHLDGDREPSRKSVCQDASTTSDRRHPLATKGQGFRVTQRHALRQCRSLSGWQVLRRLHGRYRHHMLTISPGYAMSARPIQQHFLNREKTKNLFRDIFRRDKGPQVALQPVSCSSISSPATRPIHCTPWSNPTRNIFGSQKPCYLLGDVTVRSFKS